MTPHRKILRVCAKYRRRIRAHGTEPLDMSHASNLYDYAHLLMLQLEGEEG